MLSSFQAHFEIYLHLIYFSGHSKNITVSLRILIEGFWECTLQNILCISFCLIYYSDRFLKIYECPVLSGKGSFKFTLIVLTIICQKYR